MDILGAKVLRAWAGLGVLIGKLLFFPLLPLDLFLALLSLEPADCRALVPQQQWTAGSWL